MEYRIIRRPGGAWTIMLFLIPLPITVSLLFVQKPVTPRDGDLTLPRVERSPVGPAKTGPVRPYLEVRDWWVRKVNPTFDGPADANRSDFYTRVRAGAEIVSEGNWAGTVEIQRLEDFAWTHKLNFATPNSDVSLADATYRAPNLDVTLGRQRIILANQRLIGQSAWQSEGRSFDAVKVDSGRWTAWAGRLGVANTKPETARMGALTHVDKSWGTTSFIFKHDLGTAGSIDLETFDHVASYRFGKTLVDGEAAGQVGRNNNKDHSAWAWHVAAHEDLPLHAVLSVEADAASGGSTKTESHTFDNLYQSNHDLYGLSDMMGWRNMTYYSVYLTDHPTGKLTLQAREQWYFLRDPSDAWYSASGPVNPSPTGTFQDRTGKSGRDLGSELDLEAGYTVKGLGDFCGGLALFAPGSYISKLTGHDNQMTFLFFQYQARF